MRQILRGGLRVRVGVLSESEFEGISMELEFVCDTRNNEGFDWTDFEDPRFEGGI